jgi:cytochrome c biogenesis protein CcdA
MIAAISAAFVTGLASSIGPCTATRFVAVSALTAGQSRRRALLLGAAFGAGIIGMYGLFGTCAALLPKAAAASPFTYAALSCAFAIGALVALCRAEAHDGPCRSSASAGAAAVTGGALGLVISPCCAPVMLSVAAAGTLGASPAYAAGVLASFAVGHAVPLIAAALGVGALGDALRAASARQTASAVSVSLSFALAAYYAVLA